MREELKETLLRIRGKLLDPFDVSRLEEDFRELLEMLKDADPEERLKIREEFEELKGLFYRNMEIVRESLKPLLEGEEERIMSRRV